MEFGFPRCVVCLTHSPIGKYPLSSGVHVGPTWDLVFFGNGEGWIEMPSFEKEQQKNWPQHIIIALDLTFINF